MTICSECDREISGEIVWYRPFARSVQTGDQSGDFMGTATVTTGDGEGLPFHPECFKVRTGEDPPARD